MTAERIKELAHELVERLKEDIHKAVTREEHIRLSARANEADLLLGGIQELLGEQTDVSEKTDGPSEEVSRDCA